MEGGYGGGRGYAPGIGGNVGRSYEQSPPV